MCNSKFFSFALAVALAAMVTNNATAQIGKPATGQPVVVVPAVPAPAATPEQLKVLTDKLEAIETKLGGVATRDEMGELMTKVDKLVDQLKLNTQRDNKTEPVFEIDWGWFGRNWMWLIVVSALILAVWWFVRRRRRGHETPPSITHAIALLALLGAGGALRSDAAVTFTKVEPAQLKAGTTTAMTFCTKDPLQNVRVSGSGVVVDVSRASQAGDCVSNIMVAVDVAATVGMRTIEALETVGGSFASTTSEIEILAAPAPAPPTPPTVDPRIVRLEGQVATLKLTIEGLCNADADWRRGAWGARKGSSAEAGKICRNGIKKEAVDSAVSDDRITTAMTAMNNAIQALSAASTSGSGVTETQVRGWAADEVSGVKTQVASLRTDVDEHKTAIGKLRTDMAANTATVAEVKDKAEALRALLAAKGNRGVKNALKEPKPQKGKSAPQPSAAKPVMTPAQP